jgi:type IV pilus assembly protein PilQ
MDKLNLSKKVAGTITAVIISVLLAGGCAAPKLERQDPFFDEWKTKAETSKGYSPAARKPLAEQPQIIKPKAPPKVAKIEEEKRRPLPKRTISLKMTNIDVSVVLRAQRKGQRKDQYQYYPGPLGSGVFRHPADPRPQLCLGG